MAQVTAAGLTPRGRGALEDLYLRSTNRTDLSFRTTTGLCSEDPIAHSPRQVLCRRQSRRPCCQRSAGPLESSRQPWPVIVRPAIASRTRSRRTRVFDRPLRARCEVDVHRNRGRTMVIESSQLSTSPQYSRLLADLRREFATARTRSVEWRLDQLHGIERLVEEREADIATALADDLGRSAFESWLGEVASTKAEAVYARRRLKRWMRPRRAQLPLNQLPGRAWMQYEPLGVVLIVGPWNYPLDLMLAPLVAAVAAGNCAVVKPSELAPTTRRYSLGCCRDILMATPSGSSRATPSPPRDCWRAASTMRCSPAAPRSAARSWLRPLRRSPL